MINLQVFLDGDNDRQYLTNYEEHRAVVDISWRTSVKYSETKEIGTWHWPERS
jgi:hypothetical protein